MNVNIKAKQQQTFDAIVVGSGISGGWAAKELTEKGLKTLVLERGRDVKHIQDYPTMHKNSWELPYADQVSLEEKKHFEKQSRTGYTIRESIKHWWVNDLENPYTEIKRFDWIRGYHVGGRSIMWGRHSYRWSDLDFGANANDGHGVDWPIRYKDVAPWYSYVEKFVGIQGQKEGLPHLPDGEFLPPFELNCLEKHTREKIMENFPGRVLTMGRTANLTVPHNGRGKCMARNRCIRGCPYGAYFSSNASTIPAAEKTGNMVLRPHSIVNSIIYNKDSGKATGVQILDGETGEMLEYYAKIIFLNASTLGSTFIMLNSISDRFPNGFGNDSGELGHNLMDHHFRTGAQGTFDGFKDKYYSGRRPASFYVPRFRNLYGQERDYVRGFGYQGRATRENWTRGIREMEFGGDFKDEITAPGQWTMGLGGFGEHLPYHENHVKLNHEVKDTYGMSTLTIDCEYKENEKKMRIDMANDAAEMLEASGFNNVNTYDRGGGPGLGIHEMGTARMGRDPKTSVLNAFNQVHAAPNVFVTDGACMTSSANQNPSLTYMALTARAVDHAVKELNKKNL